MNGTDTWVRAEQRTSIIAEFRSIQLVDVGEDRVVRMLFHTDFTDRFPAFVLSHTRPSNDLRTGDWYLLDDILLCRIESWDHSNRIDSEMSGGGERLSHETTRAIVCTALQVGVEGTFGYIDQVTNIILMDIDCT